MRSTYYICKKAIEASVLIKVAPAPARKISLSSEEIFNQVHCEANKFVVQGLKPLPQELAIAKIKNLESDQIRDLWDHEFGLTAENKAFFKKCIIAADVGIGFSDDGFTISLPKVALNPQAEEVKIMAVDSQKFVL